jgi:ribosomal protein S18 acetylase RimI-like enzyme
MSHVLDRPVWAALTTKQAHLAEGGPLAFRFPRDIVPFAAARDGSDEAIAALAALARPGDDMVLPEANELVIPPGFATVFAAPLVQMMLVREPAEIPDARIVPLGEADAAEMLDLATLTRPGPFTLKARALGPFVGIRIDGRLAAMAGERMKQDGFEEVSGICTHPDFRGRGLARVLSVFVTRRTSARGVTPYLHAFASNDAAIRLYESIGFAIRRELNVAMIRKDAPPAGQ